jgi:hypothetical protein
MTDILGGLSHDELEQIQQLTLHTGASVTALTRFRDIILRTATDKIRAAAEAGYRPNTARYEHWREAADLIDPDREHR